MGAADDDPRHARKQQMLVSDLSPDAHAPCDGSHRHGGRNGKILQPDAGFIKELDLVFARPAATCAAVPPDVV
ncbi:hypothetical protein DKT77_17925 [Meridianimarinicoccus roseus]|uniref:Uncharacterized protein n=1 Tax=Meridianimarinicoccus roseus TaxID=2072018 RepID=A0A2V2L7C8_9RHOB|nr:hypothetical protein DKT77_17925 [Meridianimarinicoccus roseus]